MVGVNLSGVRVRGTVVALAVVALTTTACSAGKDAVDPVPVSQFRYTDATPQGEVIPASDRKKPGDVTGDLLDGEGTYSLSADVGKVVVVNLWGAWCPPCTVETPQFQQVYLDTQASGVRFVGFDVKDDRERATAFVQDNQITYPIIFDNAARVALQLGGLRVQAGLPQTALVDKQGRIAATYVGIVKPSVLKSALATLVAES